MIKCNVTVCGTVSRQAQIRANKEGKQFISFGVKVVIPAKSGINKTIEISVAKDTDNQGEAVNYPVGSRIEVAGVLQFHKKGDIVYYNLSATGVNNFNASSQDAITGSMEFRGTIGKQVDVKTDKKGNFSGNYIGVSDPIQVLCVSKNLLLSSKQKSRRASPPGCTSVFLYSSFFTCSERITGSLQLFPLSSLYLIQRYAVL